MKAWQCQLAACLAAAAQHAVVQVMCTAAYLGQVFLWVSLGEWLHTGLECAIDTSKHPQEIRAKH